MFSHDLGRLDPFAAPLGYDRYLRTPAIAAPFVGEKIRFRDI
jgi:hypothetical protein